ncbi:GerAB/ArcD/ProY family transporter [Heliobacterium chlorum]|uniref:GerAB/ArcD/ProY family transporter n=1 Tax=Heliobacterium chlorum TaxID=2698 RepID=A0ABR7TA09_HELCL|nr:GerAB/ArcD/ProY family transporter [Heliobacterium chlorum]
MKLTSQDGYVGQIESISLIFMFTIVKTLLFFPRNLQMEAGPAGWMVPILSLIAGVLAFYFIEQLTNNFSRMSLLAIIGRIWGSPVRWLLGVVFCVSFLLFVGYQIRIFGEVIKATLLPATPISSIILTYLVLLVFIARQGFEHLTRLAWVILPWSLPLMVFALLLAIPFGDIYNLAPWFGPGAFPLIQRSLMETSMYKEISLLAFVAPLYRTQKTFRRTGYYSLILCGIIIAFSQIVFTMVYPEPSGHKVGFPLYKTIRLIHFGALWQRLEALFIFFWATMITLGLAAGVYGSAISIAQAFEAPDYRPYLFPIAVIVICIAFLPESEIEAVDGFTSISRSIAIPFLIVPFVAWLWGKLFYRKKAEPA